MNLEALAQRLQVLEDIEAIKKLKARYCAYCDDNYDADGLASLFTEDAIWDGGEILGRSEGREAIRAFFQGSSRRLTFAIHHVMNPIIDVDGDTGVEAAVGAAKDIQTVVGGRSARRIAGIRHSRL